MIRKTIKKSLLPISIVLAANSWAQETSFISIPLDPALCPSGLGVPQRPVVEDKLEIGDIHITADTVDLIEEGKSHLEGNVEMKKDEQQAKADIVDYYQPQEKVDSSQQYQLWAVAAMMILN